MVEIEHIQDIEKDQPAKSSAKEQKLKDPVDANTETQDTEVSEATEHDKQIENQEDNTPENNILVNSNTNVHDLKPGNIFYGSIKYNNPKGKQQAQQGIFLILTSKVSDIYIQTGEALTDEDAESTIERISKLFNKEE